jgi:uncharacterized protein
VTAPDVIIDAHVHILPRVRLRGLMRWIKRAFPEHPVDATIDEEGILNDLRENRISFFFNYVYPLKEEETDSLNKFNFELSKNIDVVAPFGSLHFDTRDKKGVVKKCIEDYGFVGLKFHPFVQKFDPADEKMFSVYELMEKYERPVVLHTGFDEFYQMKMPAEDLMKILDKFPNLPLVLSHCLFPRFDDANLLAQSYNNVYLDATNVFGALRFFMSDTNDEEVRGRGNLYRERFRTLILERSERTLFGSDYPVGMGGLDEIYDDIFAFGLSEAVERDLAFKTAWGFVRRFSPDVFSCWERLLGC